MPCCPKTALRLLAGVLTAEVVVLVQVSPASAQVALVPDVLAEGGTRTVTVRLSNERSSGTATRFELTFPRKPALLADAASAPGWTVTRRDRATGEPLQVDGRTAHTATDTVTFSGIGVPPGSSQDFQLTLGPLPGTGEIYFSARQTFSDGSVSTWRGAANPATPRITIGAPPLPTPPATPRTAPPGTPMAPPVPTSPTATSQPATSSGPVAERSGPEPAGQALAGASSPAAPMRPIPSPWVLLGVLGALAAALAAVVTYPALRSRRSAARTADDLLDLFDDGRADGTASPEVTSR